MWREARIADELRPADFEPACALDRRPYVPGRIPRREHHSLIGERLTVQPLRKLSRNGVVLAGVTRVMLKARAERIGHKARIEGGRCLCIQERPAHPDAAEQTPTLDRTVFEIVARNGTNIASLTKQKLLLRLSDIQDYGAFGIARKNVPAFDPERVVPGRAVVAESAQIIQIASPGVDLYAAIDRTASAWPASPHRPPPVGVLPERADAEQIRVAVQTHEYPWFLPLGIGDLTLGPAGLQIYEREHAVIAGPARSGKSTALALVAHVLRHAPLQVRTAAIALRRSPLRESPDVEQRAITRAEIAELIAAIRDFESPVVLLVDDADALDDPDGAISDLLERERPDLHLVIAGRPDALRSLFGHWTQTVRRSKLGLLLKPNLDLDGELLGVALPRRQRVPMQAGRGYLVSNGEVDLIQGARVAVPTESVKELHRVRQDMSPP